MSSGGSRVVWRFGRIHFWLGGNASLTTLHLIFIRILFLLLLLLSNVIVHPSVGSAVIRILTRPHWQVSSPSFYIPPTLTPTFSWLIFMPRIYYLTRHSGPFTLLAYFMHVCTCVGWCISREAIKPCNGTLGADLLPLSA